MKPTEFTVPGAAPAARNVVDVTEATFGTEVVDRSRDVPVVIDLWASWCAPCRQLGPVLERLADEAAGAWVLAKVDVDANPRIAQALQVQGIPAVKAVVGGEIVDEFTGAMPEPQVRQWLAGFVGAAPAVVPDDRLAIGQEAERRGDLDAALAAYRAVPVGAPGYEEARAGAARIDLRNRALGHDEAALQQRFSADPADVAAATALSDLDVLGGRAREAFARLVDVIRRTSGAERDAARAHLVALFDAFPPDDPAVVTARRDLASALF